MNSNEMVDPLRSHPPRVFTPIQPQDFDSDNGSTMAQSRQVSPSHAIGSRRQGGRGPELRAAAPVRPGGQTPRSLKATPPGKTIRQVPGGEPRRVELVDRPMSVEGHIGLVAPVSSPEGSQTAGDSERVDEGEPEFPKQVYNILLVGAEGVGQTSMILYVPLHSTGT